MSPFAGVTVPWWVPARPAVRARQPLHLDEAGVLHPLDHQLGDPLAGLDPEQLYRIVPAATYRGQQGNGQSPLDWLQAALDGKPLCMTGRLLQAAGIQAPVLTPARAAQHRAVSV